MKFCEITIADLRAYLMYVEQGSATKAAELLGISAQALSIRVKSLKTYAGDPLIIGKMSKYTRPHEGYHTRLTDYGKILYKIAFDIVQRFDNFCEVLKAYHPTCTLPHHNTHGIPFDANPSLEVQPDGTHEPSVMDQLLLRFPTVFQPVVHKSGLNASLAQCPFRGEK